MPVAIVIDSSSSLPADLLARYDITVVPLLIHIAGREYRDGVDISVSEFYRQFGRTAKTPTTATPGPTRFLEAFQRRAAEGKEIVCLCLPSGFSSVHESAVQAAQAAPEIPVTVIDLPTAAGGAALIVLAAARAAERGATRDQISSLVERLGPKVRLCAMLDTLAFLRRSGHVRSLPALATSLLDIKPIFTVEKGVARPYANVRTKRRALERLLSSMNGDLSAAARGHAAVMHANAQADAEYLRAEVLRRHPSVEVIITEFTPVMGAHTGPGVLGIAYYAANGEEPAS